MNTTARLDVILLRTILLLVTTRGGWLLIGIGLFISGLLWGLNSHQVSYLQKEPGLYHRYISEDYSFLILQQDDIHEYYVMYITDYEPAIDGATMLSDLQSHIYVKFIASTDTINVTSEVVGTGLTINRAHPIELITFFNGDMQDPVTYTHHGYSNDFNTYTVNNWLYAGPMTIAGIICAASALSLILYSRRRQKQARMAELAALHARPSPFARELAEDAFYSRQPYQGIEQYPQSESGAHVSRPYQQP